MPKIFLPTSKSLNVGLRVMIVRIFESIVMGFTGQIVDGMIID